MDTFIEDIGPPPTLSRSQALPPEIIAELDREILAALRIQFIETYGVNAEENSKEWIWFRCQREPFRTYLY